MHAFIHVPYPIYTCSFKKYLIQTPCKTQCTYHWVFCRWFWSWEDKRLWMTQSWLPLSYWQISVSAEIANFASDSIFFFCICFFFVKYNQNSDLNQEDFNYDHRSDSKGSKIIQSTYKSKELAGLFSTDKFWNYLLDDLLEVQMQSCWQR